MIYIKSDKEIEAMRASGTILARAHRVAREMISPGVSTEAIDKAIHREITASGGIPSFLDYRGYPASSCISVNDVVIHGIPSDREILRQGDLVSIDIGVFYEGYHSDAARSYGVGDIKPEVQRLIDVTRQSFYEGLTQCLAGNRLGDLSQAIQQYVERHQMSVIREYTGHGVGKSLHEDPAVPNYGQAGRGLRLQAGMTLAIEPMVNLGRREIRLMPDGWTVRTQDGSISAHYEHTVLITEGTPEILTGGDEVDGW